MSTAVTTFGVPVCLTLFSRYNGEITVLAGEVGSPNTGRSPAPYKSNKPNSGKPIIADQGTGGRRITLSFSVVRNKVSRKNTVASPAPTTASTNATSTAPTEAQTNAKAKL